MCLCGLLGELMGCLSDIHSHLHQTGQAGRGARSILLHTIAAKISEMAEERRAAVATAHSDPRVGGGLSQTRRTMT
jgi:hypothetical protein